MTLRGKRVLTLLLAAGGLVVLGWTLLVGAVLVAGGWATVQWADFRDGVRIDVPIPMALITAGALTAGALTPDHLVEVHGDLDLDEWTPFVEGLLEGLDDCPDATLVEVLDRGEVVRIAKRGGKLQVEVDADDLRFQVAVPTRSIRYTVSALLD